MPPDGHTEDAHSHSQGHSPGHGHTHVHVQEVTRDSERRVFIAMLLTGGFLVAEVIGGLLSGSLALLSDAGHMLTDAVALSLSWTAFRLGRRQANLRRSYGHHRFQVLAAFTNGLTLAFIALWITVEAIRRFRDPVEVLGGPMAVIATLGLVVNLVVLAILRSGRVTNLNVRGAALHVMGDVLGSLAAIGASAVILTTGWMPIDPLLSVFVALLILRAAWGLVRESGHILLEGTPENVDPEEVGRRLEAAIPPIAEVHHVHIWSLTGERPVLTLHAVLEEDADHDEALHRIHGALEELFGVSHSTIQIEYRDCPDDRETRAEAASVTPS